MLKHPFPGSSPGRRDKAPSRFRQWGQIETRGDAFVFIFPLDPGEVPAPGVVRSAPEDRLR
jgi:hypothetical protein